MIKKENQHTEWKSVWKDEYLKVICAFANADGGSLFIGIDDNGTIAGINKHEKLLEDLPNKIRDVLGIIAEINLLQQKDKFYIEIKVETYSTPISYHGHFYFRSGSTIQDLKGPALEKFLLGKMGRKWDGIAAQGFTFSDLSEAAFKQFKKKAARSKRIPIEELDDTNVNILNALSLTIGNELKRAAVIAFGEKPEKLITGAYVKIGFFKTDADLMYQDEIHGSLFEQVEKTMDLLLTKYTKANIDYDGLTRTETYDYPENALREALLNALIHKDYSSGNPIQISVYKDWLMIYNAGDLPKGWTVDTLKQKHTSEPANPDIANTFFRAGYIESWGRGTVKMVEQCKAAGLPEPVYEDKWGGLAVIFKKMHEESAEKTEEEFRKDFGKISERIRKDFGKDMAATFDLIAENPLITAEELALKINKSQRTIENYTNKLKKNGIITRKGPKLGGHWEIINKKE